MVQRSRENILFYEGDLDATLRAYAARIPDLVDSIPKTQLLATPEEDLIEALVSQVEISPLVLYEDGMEMEPKESKIDASQWRDRNPFRESGPIYVAGVEVTVSIPFSGDPSLWTLRPSPWSTVFPRGRITPPGGDGIGYLHLDFAQPIDTPDDALKRQLDKDLQSIRYYVGNQSGQVVAFNNNAPSLIRQQVTARKQRLKAQEGIVQRLGIPLKRRSDAPAVESIQIKRKLVKPLPPPPQSGFQPEPGISDDDYKHILAVIRHEGRTFEATPKTYAVHDEEGLRDIILAHLNGHYEGGATGETFRRSGKTDIRIEDNNRAAFVAECKVWRGGKELSSAVNQLLGYLTWRDCKAAILIFNKQNAKFTELLMKVPETLEAHTKFKRFLGQQGTGEWRYVFTSAEDELRQVTIHVFAFNLFIQ